MGVEVVTKDDLQIFRVQLVAEITELLFRFISDTKPTVLPEGLRTDQARVLLDCSNGKLLSLRASGKIRCRKIGGSLYYNQEDIRKLLKNGTGA
jgi:hypothetical protein